MKTYDVNCPLCGYLNRNQDLEKTNGRMKCQRCEYESEMTVFFDTVLPVYTGEQLTELFHVMEGKIKSDKTWARMLRENGSLDHGIPKISLADNEETGAGTHESI
ncbi:MAG: hypothetical protein LUD72_08370 [Bacteroidales bacterium]|nr:hypothetical protein [Bacteroidales bacterium]